MGQIDPKKIGAIALLTLALLIAGNGAYSYWTVDRPVAELLGNQAAVDSYEIVRRAGQQPLVELTVTRDADMVLVHEALGSELSSRLGPHELKIVDTRSPKLAEFLSRAQFALYEAAANGTFVRMQEIVAAVATLEGVEAEVIVRPGWIYLRAATPDAYLFEAIERSGTVAGGVSG